MDVDKPTALQILLAWRENKWVVARNAVEVGAYPYRTHAMEMVRRLAAEAAVEGLDCYLLVRWPDGRWDEKPCPPVRAKAQLRTCSPPPPRSPTD
jgi:hypothetical protein